MGGYSSTPKKAKTSEEGGDETIYYAASGMQGWRASMEDAHIALLKVPQGTAPSSAAIGAARIGIFSQSNNKPPLGNGGGSSSNKNAMNGPKSAQDAVVGARGRAGTYSAGDAREDPLMHRVREETQGAASAEISSAGKDGERRARAGVGAVAGAGTGAAAGGAANESIVGAGWKAVDLLEDAALFGVFDGHGGKAVADFCKERLPGLLAASPDIRAGNWKDGFPRVYHALDALLMSGEGQEKTGGWGGSTRVDGVGVGCTIVTALLDRKRGQCYVAHAGDSRCVLCRAGRAVQLTRDHKPGIPSEYARIRAAGGHVSRVGRVNDNLNLSRAIGDMVYKRNHHILPKDQMISAEPDVCRFLVTPGVDEFLILACDGVWEIMDTVQVVAFVRSGLRMGSPPREVCESLLDACLSHDPRSTRYAGCDNMTVVLVLLEGWEAALATRAYTPALTFSGGRLGSVAEAAAALSATLPKMPRKSSNLRPPLPAEFRAVKVPSTDPPTDASTSSSQVSVGDRVVEEGEKTAAAAAAAPAPVAPAAATASRARLEGNAALAARTREGAAALGWPQRRIAAGMVAPPRTAHGIEFNLAWFSAPVIPFGLAPGSRASTGSMKRGSKKGVASAAGALAVSASRTRNLSHSTSVPPNTRRRSNHLRSATAPMLPSPLLHRRRDPPSEERLAAAAAIAVLGEVGAAGAVAVAAAAEENAVSPYRHPSENGNPAAKSQLGPLAGNAKATAGEELGGRQLARVKDVGLVFVPAPEDMTPAEVTVTAAASPSRNTHSE